MSELKRAFTAEQLDALREIGFDNIQKAAQELGVWTVAQNTDAAEFERNQQALAAQKLEDENKLLKEALRFSTLEASFWRAKHLMSINPNQAEKAVGGQANDE